MQGNFSFLLTIENYRAFAAACVEAERAFAASYKASAVLARAGLEAAVKWVYAAENVGVPHGTLKTLVDDYRFSGVVEEKVYSRLRFIIKLGNFAAHENKAVNRNDATLALAALFEFVEWLDYCYGEIYAERKFDEQLLPDGNKTAVDLERLNQEVAARQQDNEQLLRKIAELSAQLQAEKVVHTQTRVFNPDSLSEFATRKRYIDMDVIDAGFTFGADCTVEYEVSPMPNRENRGFVDYVLWGANGKPLALIEAKRTSVSTEQGAHQARLYADALEVMHRQRPLIFLSNGHETWLNDDVSGYPPRRVFSVFAKADLESIIRRRGQRTNPDLHAIDDNITNRLYQKQAVKAAIEQFRQNRRAALWIMATGSGKTRTAVSLVDVLMRSGWVKNVLFLADRTALVKQAKQSFKNLLPNLSLCNLLDNRDDKTARMVFSTYNTMMNAIDSELDESGGRLFTPAHFDLVIIDEAHRSIFNKYRAIFSYFDSLLLGMTATPKSEMDKNTFEFFDVPDNMPTFDYSYDQALTDKVLVNYRTLELKTRFINEGICYSDLSDAEQAEYEREFADDDGNIPESIPPAALNQWLFNADTVDKVLVELLNSGIKVNGNTVPGKTIIFAANHNHAVFIKERFDILFPQLGGYFAQIIDNKVNYADDLIDKFKAPGKYPQLAISVDMLDTGIDIPEIVNLVFFKRVRSKSKFWQMIGRGTRLCPGLFGYGADKQFFRIIDCCDNFAFFRERPNWETPQATTTLSERLFVLKAKLAAELQDIRFAETAHQQLRSQLVAELADEIRALPPENFTVREQRIAVDKFSETANYQALTDGCVAVLCDKLARLITADSADERAKTFDAAIYALMLAKIKADVRKQTGVVRTITAVAKTLAGLGTIPQIAVKKELLIRAQAPEFWLAATVAELDSLRRELRDLLQFIVSSQQELAFTNLRDEITGRGEIEPLANPLTADADYHNKVRAYINDHRDHTAIFKLTHNQPLTRQDFAALESILWHELGDRTDFERVFQHSTIGRVVRAITGLDEQAARQAFAEFLNDNDLTSAQINYINTIIGYVCHNGLIDDNKRFNEQPFTTIGKLNEVFPLLQGRRIVEIIGEIRENAG